MLINVLATEASLHAYQLFYQSIVLDHINSLTLEFTDISFVQSSFSEHQKENNQQ